MIKCNIKLFDKQEVEVEGGAAAIFSELTYLLTEIMKRLSREQ